MSSKKHNAKYLTKRDIFGRNYSYVASCLPSVEDINDINPYDYELESGYTPLHLTLKEGYLKKSFKIYKTWKTEKEYLSHKYGGHILNQKDREGLTALDLYNVQFQVNIRRYPKYLTYRAPASDHSTIEWENNLKNLSFPLKSNFMSKPITNDDLEYLKEHRGSHILTLGSNINHQLGTGTKDDRTNFFQLHIDQLNDVTFPPSKYTFTTISITKYHSVILTSNHQIYTCGNPTRGRLGNNSTDRPQFSFSHIMDLEDIGIQAIDTSDHHSIVLDGNGDVYTWGWNAYCQLGYSTSSNNKKTDDKNIENMCSSVPRKVHFCDNKDIVMVACSSIHTCVITKDHTVFMWGLNLGQMGNSKISHILPDGEYMGQPGHIISKPVTVNLSHLEIEQVVCTEFATFIRTKGNTLHILTGYTIKTFKISLPRSKNFKEIDAFKDFSPRGISSDVTDMKCSNPYGNNICFQFSCGRIGIISSKNESPKMWSKFSNTLPISLHWTPKIELHKCLDFEVGSKGCLIVCTFGGEIFMSRGPTDSFEKTHSSKLITGRAIGVSCDSSFDSFAVIKDELNTIPIYYPNDDLIEGFSQYSPIYEINRSYEDVIYGTLNRSNFNVSMFQSNNKPIDNENSLSMDTSIQNNVPPENNNHTPSIAKYITKCKYDVEFINDTTGQYICGCHKTILKSRCRRLIKNLRDSREFIIRDGMITIKLKGSFSDQIWKIRVSSLSDQDIIEKTIKSVTHFLYTDEKPDQQQTAMLLTNIVEDSLHTSKFLTYSQTLLDVCLMDKIEGVDIFDELNLEKPDTIIYLENGEYVMAHSLFLATRSIYFSALISDKWISKNSNNLNVIKLHHIKKPSFVIIMKFLYGVPYTDIIDSELLNFSFAACLEVLLDTLEVADEFTLVPFKAYLESIVAQFINGGSVIPILLNAINSNAVLLTENCSMFMCTHIGILFCKENLELIDEYFTTSTWSILEEMYNNITTLRNDINIFDLCWYKSTEQNWIELYKSNLESFNSKFMKGSHSFEPVFDIKFDSIHDKSKSSSRRRSSVFQKNRRSSSIHYEFGRSNSSSLHEKHIQLKNPCESTSSLHSENSSAVEDSSEQFIEVSRKSKKKRADSSSSRRTSESSAVIVNNPSIEIVLHTNNEGSNHELPSLLETKLIDDEHHSLSKEDLNSKINGTFKKNTQKERKKQLEFQSVYTEKESKKEVWGGKPPVEQERKKSIQSSPQEQLPSLLNVSLSQLKSQPKKNKKKQDYRENEKKIYTEFVSSGNPGGIRPYIMSTETTVNEIATVFGNKSADVASSLEEQLAAKEFEEWFAKESANVQNKIKKSKHNASAEIQALYSSADNMPNLINNTNTMPSKKKVKGKFPSKRKATTELSEIL